MSAATRTQRAQLALGSASFVLLIALVGITLLRPRTTSEGRHEIQHAIVVNGEPLVVLTRALAGESIGDMMLRHKAMLDRARKGE